MIHQDDWTRLARFAAGECSAEEANEIARWVEEAPERREALAFIRGVDTAANAGRPQWDTNVAWERLTVRRTRLRQPLHVIPTTAGHRRRPWPVMAAAIAAALIVAMAAGIWQSRWLPLGRGAAPMAGLREYVTAPGHRATLHLPDGSLVVLAAATRFRYPPSLGAAGSRRDVYLEGQALFQVEHDERRPFVVHTAHGVTEDLGTRFTVQDYPRDTVVQVVVTEGRVELRGRGRTPAGVLLRPSQLGRLFPNGDAAVRAGIDTARYLAWTEGRLVYDETPVRDVLAELGRWYDLEFVVTDSTLGARHLTATFGSEAIAQTLTLLGGALGVEYERHGRTVTLRPRPEPAAARRAHSHAEP